MEHPADSSAFATFGLPLPGQALFSDPGYTIYVEQCWFGHEAIKPTWLYYVGSTDLPPMPNRERPERLRPLEHLSKRQRAATPIAFARWLVELAASAARYVSAPNTAIDGAAPPNKAIGGGEGGRA